MKRWLFTFLASVSLFLLLLIIGLWTASQFRNYSVCAHKATPDGQLKHTYTIILSAHAGAIQLVIGEKKNARRNGGAEAMGQWQINPTALEPITLGSGVVSHFLGLGYFEGQFDGNSLPMRGPPVRPLLPRIQIHTWIVTVPLWMLMLLLMPLPTVKIAMELRQRRQRLRQLRGQCLACGYSLTGNVSGVCPECGTAIPQVAKGASA